MKALVYRGARQVRIENVDDPKIEKPTDVVVRMTTTNICGSDLHMYEGRTSVEEGKVLGHENLGEVVEVGGAVQSIKKGEMVCLPFNIACGYCKNCESGLTGFCLTMNPDGAGAAYGYANMGPYQGGQAEYLRVPHADFNCLKLPEDAREKENDYVMLSDIWPTGWHATELAGLKPGESIVIFGSGPVGLMAALAAKVKGASQILVVDRHQDRLRLAEEIGATAIDDSEGDPVERVKELTRGGADRGCDCVGWQCHDPEGEEHPNMVLNALVQSVRPTAGLGLVGVYVPDDPKPATELMKKGEIAFDFGTFFEKGLHMGSGQCNVKMYNRYLCDLIHRDLASPSWIISHELGLDEAPDAYEHFDCREEGWTKVILHPAGGKAGQKHKREMAHA